MLERTVKAIGQRAPFSRTSSGRTSEIAERAAVSQSIAVSCCQFSTASSPGGTARFSLWNRFIVSGNTARCAPCSAATATQCAASREFPGSWFRSAAQGNGGDRFLVHSVFTLTTQVSLRGVIGFDRSKQCASARGSTDTHAATTARRPDARRQIHRRSKAGRRSTPGRFPPFALPTALRLDQGTSGRQASPASQHFMDAGNAAAKLVPRVKDGGIGVGDFRAAGEHRVQPRTVILRVMYGLQKFHGSAGPHRPLSQQVRQRSARCGRQSETR